MKLYFSCSRENPVTSSTTSSGIPSEGRTQIDTIVWAYTATFWGIIYYCQHRIISTKTSTAFNMHYFYRKGHRMTWNCILKQRRTPSDIIDYVIRDPPSEGENGGNMKQLSMLLHESKLKMYGNQKDKNTKIILSLNHSKIKAIIFITKPTILYDKESPFTIGSSTIKIVPHFKMLWVFFYAKLCWKQHINSIASKLSSVIGIIYEVANILSYHWLMTLYNSFFLSVLDYCCVYVEVHHHHCFIN